jgi:hypothetical protein
VHIEPYRHTAGTSNAFHRRRHARKNESVETIVSTDIKQHLVQAVQCLEAVVVTAVAIRRRAKLKSLFGNRWRSTE